MTDFLCILLHELYAGAKEGFVVWRAPYVGGEVKLRDRRLELLSQDVFVDKVGVGNKLLD